MVVTPVARPIHGPGGQSALEAFYAMSHRGALQYRSVGSKRRTAGMDRAARWTKSVKYENEEPDMWVPFQIEHSGRNGTYLRLQRW